MNVADHQKHLQAIKTKEAAAAAAAGGFKATRRRRSLLTRESSNLSNYSIEAAEYHAQELAAVPFVWESTPGTPKRQVNKKSSCHEIDHDLGLPPLTPPPSYLCQNYKGSNTRTRVSSKKRNQNDGNSYTNNNNNNVNNLIQSIFPRLSIKRDHPPRPPTLSSSSSTKSSSSPKSSTSSSSSSSQSRFVESTPSLRPRRLSFDYSSRPQIGEEEDEVGSPVSTLCFRRLSCYNRRFRGLYN